MRHRTHRETEQPPKTRSHKITRPTSIVRVVCLRRFAFIAKLEDEGLREPASIKSPCMPSHVIAIIARREFPVQAQSSTEYILLGLPVRKASFIFDTNQTHSLSLYRSAHLYTIYRSSQSFLLDLLVGSMATPTRARDPCWSEEASSHDGKRYELESEKS